MLASHSTDLKSPVSITWLNALLARLNPDGLPKTRPDFVWEPRQPPLERRIDLEVENLDLDVENSNFDVENSNLDGFSLVQSREQPRSL